MTSAPTQVSDDDAKAAYLKRCMDMTHGQLYAELMRVHKEATALVQSAVEQEKKVLTHCYYELLKFAGDERWKSTSTGITVQNVAQHLELPNPYDYQEDQGNGNNT